MALGAGGAGRWARGSGTARASRARAPGRTREPGKPFAVIHFFGKGGAGRDLRGSTAGTTSARSSSMGGSRAPDPELFELRSPHLILRLEYQPDSAGAGALARRARGQLPRAVHERLARDRPSAVLLRARHGRRRASTAARPRRRLAPRSSSPRAGSRTSMRRCSSGPRRATCSTSIRRAAAASAIRGCAPSRRSSRTSRSGSLGREGGRILRRVVIDPATGAVDAEATAAARAVDGPRVTVAALVRRRAPRVPRRPALSSRRSAWPSARVRRGLAGRLAAHLAGDVRAAGRRRGDHEARRPRHRRDEPDDASPGCDRQRARHASGAVRRAGPCRDRASATAPSRRMGQKPATRAALAAFVARRAALSRRARPCATPAGGDASRTSADRGACPPILIAASGPKMLRLAGEIGDGAIITARAAARCRRCSTASGTGAAASWPGRAPFRTCLSASLAIHADREPALQAVRPHVASTLRAHVHWELSDAAGDAKERIAAAYDILPAHGPGGRARGARARRGRHRVRHRRHAGGVPPPVGRAPGSRRGRAHDPSVRRARRCRGRPRSRHSRGT